MFIATKSIKKLSMTCLFLLMLTFSSNVFSEPLYISQWLTTDNAGTSIIVDAIDNVVGSGPENAADNAIPRCKSAIKKLLSNTSSTKYPIFFRTKAYKTTSEYMYYGNCDIMVLNK